MKTHEAAHMVRYEDLNHHANLYAGRAIEWMVESSFVAITLAYGDGEGLRYKNTHKFDFMKSVYPGDIISFASTVVRFGRTSATIHVDLIDDASGEVRAEGYTTFVTVDKDGRSMAHGMELDETDDPQELKWRKEANSFFNK